MIYILDACALLSYLNDEPGSDIIEDLLKKAAVILKAVHNAPIRVIPVVSAPVFQESSRLKASYKCSLADAIGLAMTVELSGHFVSSDHHELEIIAEKESIPFLWLPPHPKTRAI